MQNYADAIVDYLPSFGGDKAFGVSGTNIHHIWKALHRPDIKVYDFRHESGAAFAAAEYSIQTGNFVIVFVTSGPGITNAITGLRCARADGARIIFIAGLTSEETGRTGRRLFQETFPMDVEGMTGPAVDGALSNCVIVKDAKDVWRLGQNLLRIERDPRGGVLGVFLTDAKSQSLISQQRPKSVERIPSPSLSKEAIDACKEVFEMLKTKGSALWIGYGCRGASSLVRQLAERFDLPVLATPRAKGIFPETHTLYQGTTGLGASLNPEMRATPPTGVLLLGSKAAELSSMFIQDEWAHTNFYCVSLETSEVKRNMPKGSVFIEAEIGPFLQAVLEIKVTGHKIVKPPIPKAAIPPIPATSNGPNHPSDIMSVIQDVAINRGECSIIADAGKGLCWTAHYLKFCKHGLYRSNLDYSPLGHAACGVVGMGLAGNHAVAIVSDAAMLKQSEVSTAVLCGSKAIWLVLNTSHYGTFDQPSRAWGDVPPPHCIPYTDFELLARAVVCPGSTVTGAEELRKALLEALARDGPTVINVVMDS